jgi:hypothetical protein
MKINYRLEVSYQVFEKEKTFFENHNYIFNRSSASLNRQNVFKRFESFKHVFQLASTITNDIKLSVTEVINKNIYEFKIPSVNVYYSLNDFSEQNEGVWLYGDYMGESNEKYISLVNEHKVYVKENITGIKTKIIQDPLGNYYTILTSKVKI